MQLSNKKLYDTKAYSRFIESTGPSIHLELDLKRYHPPQG